MNTLFFRKYLSLTILLLPVIAHADTGVPMFDTDSALRSFAQGADVNASVPYRDDFSVPLIFKFIDAGQPEQLQAMLKYHPVLDTWFGEKFEPRYCRMNTLWGEPYIGLRPAEPSYDAASRRMVACRMTVFDRAAQAKQNGLPMTDFLLAAGADPVAGICNSRFLSDAIYERVLDKINNPGEIFCPDDGQTLLIKTIRNPERVAMLIQRGADVNIQDKAGNTPILHLAYALKANEDVTPDGPIARSLDLLVKGGANVNARGAWDDFPLSLAIRYNSDGMVKLLLAHGADPNQARNGQAQDLESIEGAFESGNLQLVDALVQHGADLNKPTKSGVPLLVTAVTRNRVENARYLLEHGADPNITDKNGNTLYQIATDNRKEISGMRELLVDSGIDITKINNRAGEPPLYSAVFEDNIQLATKLLEHGADPFYKSTGTDLLYVADANHNKDMHALLQEYMKKVRSAQGGTSASVTAIPGASVTGSHLWSASGVNINGLFNVKDAMDWECHDGSCVLFGPYGEDMAMDICHALSWKIGNLSSFSNDAGLMWNAELHPELLKQCNQRGLREHVLLSIVENPKLFFITGFSLAVLLFYGFFRVIWFRIRN